MNLPVYYDYSNIMNAAQSPAGVHVANTTLHSFYVRYLLQKAMSVFTWDMPKEWSASFFLYVLYCNGVVCVLDHDDFGVIPQFCTLTGYNVFYQPVSAIVTNPCFDESLTLKIGDECEIIKLMPDFGGIMDLVNYYADMLALCSEGAAINILNSKLAYIFACRDKTAAESLKKMYDKVASGEPAAFADKRLFNDDGSPAWDSFTQDLRANYIAGDILEDMKKWEDKFCADLGIPNLGSNHKKERLISDEANANNIETASRAEMWLEFLKEQCKKVSERFNIKLTVDWRHDPTEEMEVHNAIDTISNGAI